MKDGGPAFAMPSGPKPEVEEFTHYNEGLSVRDYFAAKAMPDLLWEFHRLHPKDGDATWIPAMARLSYEVADAMLKAREQ